MSTNYYWYGPCRECGHFQRMHIGLSSAGWYFYLHVIPGVIDTLDDWKERFEDEDSFILDEYHRPIASEEMLSIIQDRTKGRLQSPYPKDNYTEVDTERSLLYPKVRDGYCIGHGDGPWSYIIGEFS